MFSPSGHGRIFANQLTSLLQRNVCLREDDSDKSILKAAGEGLTELMLNSQGNIVDETLSGNRAINFPKGSTGTKPHAPCKPPQSKLELLPWLLSLHRTEPLTDHTSARHLCNVRATPFALNRGTERFVCRGEPSPTLTSSSKTLARRPYNAEAHVQSIACARHISRGLKNDTINLPNIILETFISSKMCLDACMYDSRRIVSNVFEA
jgi:hypothetical protein